MNMENRNQSLQEFDDQNFDDIDGGNDDDLINDDMMDDDALADLGDGLMMTNEDDVDLDAGDDQIPDMDEMEFGQNQHQPQSKRLEDVDLSRDSGEDFEED